jgi:hypothetical protein
VSGDETMTLSLRHRRHLHRRIVWDLAVAFA